MHMSRTGILLTGEQLDPMKTSVFIFHDSSAFELITHTHSNSCHNNKTFTLKYDHDRDRRHPFEVVDDVEYARSHPACHLRTGLGGQYTHARVRTIDRESLLRVCALGGSKNNMGTHTKEEPSLNMFIASIKYSNDPK